MLARCILLFALAVTGCTLIVGSDPQIEQQCDARACTASKDACKKACSSTAEACDECVNP